MVSLFDLGGSGFCSLPDPPRKPIDGDAVEALLEAADKLPPLSGFRGLLLAVLLVAVRDWERGNQKQRTDAADFFRSDWCRFILDMTGLPVEVLTAVGVPVVAVCDPKKGECDKMLPTEKGTVRRFGPRKKGRTSLYQG